MSTTRISVHLKAPRARVYRALLDASAVTTWKVPTGMTSRVHVFEPREGGAFRVSLTYDAATGTGKTTTLTDADGGTDLHAVHEGLPPGVRAEDNEAGWRSSLRKLAALVEGA